MKNNEKNLNMNNNLLLIIVAIVVVFLSFILMNLKNTPTPPAEPIHVGTLEKGKSLIIPTAEISNDASFYSVEVEGVVMEVIAVKDSKGEIRTAFNTCQVCYDSGRGYYVQDGEQLVCQNCGNRFTMDQVEIETGGCNPWPISDKNKLIKDNNIEITYDFLVHSQDIFSHWRNNL